MKINSLEPILLLVLGMEVQVSRFRSPFLFSFHKVFREIISVSGLCFSLSGRKRKKSLSPIKFSLVEQGLRPRPKPEPLKFDVDRRRKLRTEETPKKKASRKVCAQMEKLVLQGNYQQALELFENLEIAGPYDVGGNTYDALMKACIGLKSVHEAKRVFSSMLRTGFAPDQYMSNRVLLMHLRCGLVEDAMKLFDEMHERNLVSWNMIISGLVDHGDYVKAFQLFLTMWEEFSESESRTFTTMIRASAGLGVLFEGRQLHSCVLKMGAIENVYVSCALVDMYSKCGNIGDARCVFDGMPEKTTVAWNNIIAGYALHGYSEEALSLYYEMSDSGAKMDNFTFSILVRVCARLASLEHAKQAHAGLIRHGWESDIVANTALVDFYGKWGRIEDAQHIFSTMSHKNIISWNALIAGYAHHGQGTKAVETFEQMLHEGIRPDHVTILAVLSGCSYSGLSERGWEIFESMSRDHNLKRREMHYACMVELLGQEGLLHEAFALITDAPFEPTPNMWAALLTACRVHRYLDLGEFAAKKLYESEPSKLSNCIVLLNIYNRCGKLKEASAVVQNLKSKGLSLLQACSWVEIKKQPHVFHSGDKSHVQAKEIYQKLGELMQEISKHGYVSERRFFLPDVNEHEMHTSLYHSEKLAVAFGVMSTCDGTSLRIVQSHRICDDCHSAMKLIALVTKREIVVRDAHRFHHFKEGGCSCCDYW